MTEFRTRLRRVRMKNGGADVRVIGNPVVEAGEEDWRGTLAANARSVANWHSDDNPLVTYLVLGVFKDGTYSFGYRHDAKASPIPTTFLPTYVAEVVRREMIAGAEARDVFNEMFEWVEG